MIQPVILAAGRLLVALGIVSVLFITSPLLALVVTLVVGGSYAVVYVVTRKRPNIIGRDRVEANRERFTEAAEALNGIKDAKILNVGQTFLDRFNDPSRRFSRHQATSQTIAALPRYAIETVAFGTVVLILVYFVAMDRDFSGIVPILGLYAFSGYRLMPGLQQMFQTVRFNRSALDIVLHDLEGSTEVRVHQRVLPDTTMGLSRQVELKHIRFSYPAADRRAINDVVTRHPDQPGSRVRGCHRFRKDDPHRYYSGTFAPSIW